MLAHCLRRWPNIKPALGERLVFAGMYCLSKVTNFVRIEHYQSQQTQNICITFVQRWPNVFDVGPTFHKCYANVLCLLDNTLLYYRSRLICHRWERRGCFFAIGIFRCWRTCPIRCTVKSCWHKQVSNLYVK